MEKFIIGILSAGFMYSVINFVVIPKFFNDVQNISRETMRQSQATIDALKAKQAKEKADREAKLAQPLYVEKPHGGYTIRKADIRTCADLNCSVVGKLDADKMVYWNKIENGFINYDSAYYIKIADVKPAY